MSAKPKVLVVCDDSNCEPVLPQHVRDTCEVVKVYSLLRALRELSHKTYAGLYLSAGHLQEALRLGRAMQDVHILDGMPDGVTLLDAENKIIWANARFLQWLGCEDIVNRGFYAVLGNPEILGPDFCPFHTALATGQPSNSTIRVGENRYFHTHAAPLMEPDGSAQHLIVTVRDVTTEILQQQKLEAIHKAGIELADLTPEEVFNMEVDDRIELLKLNILKNTQDLLHFDVVEIRLLDDKTCELVPLLSVGIEEDAAKRPLFAHPQHNGVTGFVAATGKSYLCEDTTEDPLYIEGFKGAKSSLTVPLVFHDQVIGTFNVESPETGAFGESDLQFLEIFSRDVAAALNTLELLVAEKASTAAESVEAIHSAVALPVDDILNDAVNILERYIGHQPEMAERLQCILRNARDIKQVIQKVGQKMAPTQAHPVPLQSEERTLLRDRQVLVADADDSVRGAAHALLERYGCIVETAHNGDESVFMVRNMLPHGGYDVIIADIRLPDITGYDLLLRLQEFMDHVPLVLMTGFGYDPGHSIVKARQAGLEAVLYKPFRLDQLLETVERIVQSRDAVVRQA